MRVNRVSPGSIDWATWKTLDAEQTEALVTEHQRLNADIEKARKKH